MAKELEGLEEGPKAEIHIVLQRMILKKYQTGKRQAMMKYMDYGLRNSPPFVTDKRSKGTDVYKKYTNPNRWPKEGLHIQKDPPP